MNTQGRTTRRTLVAATAAALAAPRTTRAQAGYPERTIRIVLPYAGGGGLDAMTRGLARALAPALGPGAVVVVEPKPGGATRVGTMEVFNARPDGYTLLLYPPVAWIGYFHSATFDRRMWREMTPIAEFAHTPYNTMITRAGSGLESWARVVEKARRTPGGITGAGPAAGGFLEFSFNESVRRAGIPGTYVPYRGGGEALTALIAGHVDLYILPLGDALGRVRAGEAHLIAVSSAERHPLAPDVPTYAELGIGDTLQNTFSLWGPPGLPAPVVARLSEAVRVAMADPAFVELAANRMAYTLAFRPGNGLPAELDALDAEWAPRFAAGAAPR